MARRIMVIDDMRDTVELVKTILEKEGYEVVSASNGREALEKLRNMEKKPDLVLVDMFMPEMSGRELCERIRNDESLKNLKLAFLTVAAFRDEGRKLLKKLDIADYIAKPFDVDDLVRRVKKIIGK